MVMDLELLIHTGVGEVRFGMPRVRVRELLGDPVRSDDAKDFFMGGLVHVHYSPMQQAELIVLVAGVGARLAGVDLLSVDARQAIAAASRLGPVDTTDAEYPTTATFRTLDLNLWRSALPEESGDPAHERFEAVGLGAKGYFSRARPT